MQKKFLKVILLSMVALTTAACGGGTSAGTAGNTSGSGTEEKMDVYFLTKILGNQYWSVVEEGAKKAADELGVNLIVTGLANESEVEKQVQQLQDAVSANADAIVIGPTDSTAMVNPVKDAFDSGIPVVIVDTMINSEDYSVAYTTNNVEAGKTAAEEMIARLKKAGVKETEEAQVAVQIGSSGSQTIIDRMTGFNEYWEANAPDKWVVLNDDVKVNDGDITKAVGFAQDFLTAYPNLKGVFGPNNGSTVGFVTGLQEANRTDIVLVGFDFSTEMEQMIRLDKYQVSTIVQKQYLMGYEGVKEAVALAKGETPKEKLVDTGTMVVDIENIDNEDVQTVINPAGN